MTQPPPGLPDPAADLQAALDDILHDPEAERTRPTGDPHSWQDQFERELAAITSQGAGLAEAMQRVVGAAENQALAVAVGPSGRLLELRFRPGAKGGTAEEWTTAFAEAYAAARNDANAQVAQLLTDAGLEPDPAANPQAAAAVREATADRDT